MKVWLISLIMLFAVTTFAAAQSDQIIKTEQPSFSAEGVRSARFETGAGSLTIVGQPGGAGISVTAEYRARVSSQEEAQRVLENLVLTAEVQGDTFFLKTEQRRSWGWGDSGRIDLTVMIPAHIALLVNDGSGSILISEMGSDIEIEDGSGEIRVEGNHGNIVIDDGSGTITLLDVVGNVEIDDGSGGIEIRHIEGSVRVNDGSGSIDVVDVTGDFTVSDDGSGSIRHRDVRGRVDIPRKR